MPKFHVGDSVFLLKDNAIQSDRIVMGVVALYDHEPTYADKRKAEFKEYKYCFGVATSVSSYRLDWVDEERIAHTKEELLARL